jgi:hypothetical protein
MMAGVQLAQRIPLESLRWREAGEGQGDCAELRWRIERNVESKVSSPTRGHIHPRALSTHNLNGGIAKPTPEQAIQ